MLIAVDVDGTLYDGETVADEAIRALRRARDEGHIITIVTGRRWDDLDRIVPAIVRLCDQVVCEHGGVLVESRTARLTLLAEPIEPELIAALSAAGIPDLDIGHVVAGAPAASLARVTSARDRVGSRRIIITNKDSIALAPPECDKGSGLRAAIAELELQRLPILAIGDAENDLPMFRIATFAVGVANADEAVRASGVPLTMAAVGRGVAEALDRYAFRPPPN